MSSPVLMGSDVLSHQHFLSQVANVSSERNYSPHEIMLRFPQVRARYTSAHATDVELSLLGLNPIQGDTVLTFAFGSKSIVNANIGLHGTLVWRNSDAHQAR